MDMANLASVLGVNNDSKNLGKSTDAGIGSSIISSYNDATTYNYFMEATSTGNEGAWLGYKGGSTGTGIVISNAIGIALFSINSSGVISYKKILTP